MRLYLCSKRGGVCACFQPNWLSTDREGVGDEQRRTQGRREPLKVFTKPRERDRCSSSRKVALSTWSFCLARRERIGGVRTNRFPWWKYQHLSSRFCHYIAKSENRRTGRWETFRTLPSRPGSSAVQPPSPSRCILLLCLLSFAPSSSSSPPSLSRHFLCWPVGCAVPPPPLAQSGPARIAAARILLYQQRSVSE